jgi:hypothetical protein
MEHKIDVACDVACGVTKVISHVVSTIECYPFGIDFKLLCTKFDGKLSIPHCDALGL